MTQNTTQILNAYSRIREIQCKRCKENYTPVHADETGSQVDAVGACECETGIREFSFDFSKKSRLISSPKLCDNCNFETYYDEVSGDNICHNCSLEVDKTEINETPQPEIIRCIKCNDEYNGYYCYNCNEEVIYEEDDEEVIENVKEQRQDHIDKKKKYKEKK